MVVRPGAMHIPCVTIQGTYPLCNPLACIACHRGHVPWIYGFVSSVWTCMRKPGPSSQLATPWTLAAILTATMAQLSAPPPCLYHCLHCLALHATHSKPLSITHPPIINPPSSQGGASSPSTPWQTPSCQSCPAMMPGTALMALTGPPHQALRPPPPQCLTGAWRPWTALALAMLVV